MVRHNKPNLQQPLSPEEVPFQQWQENQRIVEQDQDVGINPGDYADESKTLAEKARQVAVNTADLTGEQVVIPTYFIFEDQNDGRQEALHHVRDAEEISDLIRQMRLDEDGNRKWW
ncbi:MAG: hypothetical protein GVY17_01975 [Cyanobacteria bacterium]|jgi:hypothetical protein|nr:hypothetical protein [Cyanobacteria bacterium GSL.Bin21]